MKTTKSLLFGGLLASMLIWNAPLARGQETQEQLEGMVFRVSTEDGSYCHLKFPPMNQASLSWDRPVFQSDAGLIDFYGPCNYNPLGHDEITAQRRIMHEAVSGDGE